MQSFRLPCSDEIDARRSKGRIRPLVAVVAGNQLHHRALYRQLAHESFLSRTECHPSSEFSGAGRAM